MRTRLALAAAAITATVVLAFVIPLGLLIRTVAFDRATATAERAAQGIAPVLATGVAPPVVTQVVANASDPGVAELSVVRADGTVVGAPVPVDDSIELARRDFRTFSIEVPGGRRLYVPVQRADGAIDVISVFVPTDRLTRGVHPAWLLLAGLGVILVLVAVAVADRLARRIVGPVGELAATAERLGQGDLAVRVEPDGPPEIVEVGHVLNRLADRIGDLLAAERELVADLSHRLRTPITALRLDGEALRDPDERERVSTDVDELVRAVDRVIAEARRTGEDAGAALSDLGQLARDRVAFWSVLAEEQGRRFSTSIPDGPCPVPVGGEDLEAALDAALGNVLAHTPDGTAFRVAVEPVPATGAQPARWRLVVEDDGPGFGAADAQRGRSGSGSTGLGLDIVRRTAERSGGSLELGRAEGGGARIAATFGPITQVQSSPPP